MKLIAVFEPKTAKQGALLLCHRCVIKEDANLGRFVVAHNAKLKEQQQTHSAGFRFTRMSLYVFLRCNIVDRNTMEIYDRFARHIHASIGKHMYQFYRDVNARIAALTQLWQPMKLTCSEHKTDVWAAPVFHGEHMSYRFLCCDRETIVPNKGTAYPFMPDMIFSRKCDRLEPGMEQPCGITTVIELAEKDGHPYMQCKTCDNFMSLNPDGDVVKRCIKHSTNNRAHYDKETNSYSWKCCYCKAVL